MPFESLKHGPLMHTHPQKKEESTQSCKQTSTYTVCIGTAAVRCLFLSESKK